MTEPSDLTVTHTVMETEYREAIEAHGEDAAFRELEKLYMAEKKRRDDA